MGKGPKNYPLTALHFLHAQVDLRTSRPCGVGVAIAGGTHSALEAVEIWTGLAVNILEREYLLLLRECGTQLATGKLFFEEVRLLEETGVGDGAAIYTKISADRLLDCAATVAVGHKRSASQGG